jgi:hypothetical protein
MTPIVAVRIAIDMNIFNFVHNSPKDEFEGWEITSQVGGDSLLVCM